jgi:hypothetical protein
MKFLDRYNSVMSFQVNMPKDAVTTHIMKLVKNKILEKEHIKFVVSPSFFDPFAPRGYVNCYLTLAPDPQKTNVRCEVFPGPVPKTSLYGVSGILVLWSVPSLIVWPTANTLLIVGFGWLMMILAIHCSQILNRAKLENYVNYVFRNIKRVKQNDIRSSGSGPDL